MTTPQSACKSRRAFIAGTIAALATSSCAPRSPASDIYPSRDLTFVIPNAAGGSNDLYGRLLGQALDRRLPEESVVPLNIASGGGGKGIVHLFRAAADGYTLGILSVPGIFMLQHIRSLPHDFGRFTWLCSLTSGESYGLAVPGGSAVRTLEDLRALSRERPVRFGATGPESTSYSATVVSTKLLGLNSRIVSGYRGSTDFMMGAHRGDTDAVVAPLAAIQAMSASAETTMRLLASYELESSFAGVPGAAGLDQPDLASITVKRVIAAPPGLPDSIRRTLSRELLECAADDAVQDYARRLGEEMDPQGFEQTTAFVLEQQRFLQRWRPIIDGFRR